MAAQPHLKRVFSMVYSSHRKKNKVMVQHNAACGACRTCGCTMLEKRSHRMEAKTLSGMHGVRTCFARFWVLLEEMAQV